MRRLPIRTRLTVAFAITVLSVLGLASVGIYVRVRSELDRGIAIALEARSADVTQLLRRTSRTAPTASLKGLDETIAQVIDRDGRVIDSTPTLARQHFLTRRQLGRAMTASITIDSPSLRPTDERLRLLASPLTLRGVPVVVVVGASLEDRNDALASMRSQLLLGLPIALLLTTLAGYALAGAALRPVTALRQSAEEISRSGPGIRLATPHARDEISELATTLNAMLERIDASAQRERQFVADASHELRTPLALLKAELELALRPQRTDAERQNALRDAAADVDGLAQLSDDLLLIARADQGELPLRREPTDAQQLLTGIARRFAQRAQNQARAIEIETNQVGPLHIDAPRVNQALANLVENALRHGQGTITLIIDAGDEAIKFAVQDQGHGLAEDFKPHAFDRFRRGDEARTEPGAGLGLAIVQLIAKTHGGATFVDQNQRGCEIGFTLPTDANVESDC